MQKTSSLELRDGRSAGEKSSRQVWVAGGQDQAAGVGDGDFINQGILLSGFELCLQAFADFESTPDIVMDILGIFRIRPQAQLLGFRYCILGLKKDLL